MQSGLQKLHAVFQISIATCVFFSFLMQVLQNVKAHYLRNITGACTHIAGHKVGHLNDFKITFTHGQGRLSQSLIIQASHHSILINYLDRFVELSSNISHVFSNLSSCCLILKKRNNVLRSFFIGDINQERAKYTKKKEKEKETGNC